MLISMCQLLFDRSTYISGVMSYTHLYGLGFRSEVSD